MEMERRGLRGVREDFSELGRHLLDLSCLLGPLLSPARAAAADSPPPSPRHRPPHARLLAGVLSDLRELRGCLTGGVARLLGRAGDGLAPEVVEFVRELVECPDSWAEFPVPPGDDFEMTRPQREHIVNVERLVPNLEALRKSLCPNQMSEQSFWKIYFALLHPKLNKYDSELLSTEEIVESMRITKKKMLNRVNNQTQRPMVLSDEGSDTQPEDDQVLNSFTVTNSTLQQTTHRQSETPSCMDRSIVVKEQNRSEGDNLPSEREEDNHNILDKHQAPQLPVGGRQISYSFDNWFRLKRRIDSLSEVELTDKESEEWQNVEDSDFEIVENTS